MSTTASRVFAARLAGLPVFDPSGDQVGKVRDVVVVMRSELKQPRVVGLVVEVFGRRQVFAPMTRITSIDAGAVITTGLLNMRRFAKRSTETLVIGQLLDRRVVIKESGIEGIIYTDIGRDGMGTGINIEATVRLAQPLRVPVYASGGIHNVEHVKALKPFEADGIAGVVCGRALYEGTLDFAAAVAALR